MRRLPGFGLTARLVFLAVIAVLPALVIQAYNEYDLRHAREDDIRQRVIQITRQFGEEMGELREGARQLLVALTRFSWINTADPTECSRNLKVLKAGLPNYESLSVADATGRTVCSSSSTEPANVAKMPFFTRAMATGNLAVGDYWKDPVTGAQVIHFALRFDGPDGKVAGVVSAALDLNWLTSRMADRGLSPGASILIADRDGNIISRLPDPATLIGKNMRKTHERIMDGDTAGWEEAKGVDGITRIFGYVPAALPPYDLFLSAGLPKIAAFSDIDRASLRGVALIFVGLIVAILAALYGGSHFIKRPIQDLAGAAMRWRDGDYTARASGRESVSEFSQLALAFNEMADAVASRQAAQKKAEEQLVELASTLEERVDQRTEELAQANRVKSQFLANMSHEIRTPMNGVLGMLELLLEENLSPKQRQYALTAFRSGESLLHIVNGVLDLSKIEAGKLFIATEQFDLHTMIDESVQLFSGAASAKKIKLAHLISPATPSNVIGDEGRIRQVLTNVLGNAVKFTASGEVVLYVNAVELGPDRTRLDFRVRDTGIGIPPEKLRDIFDIFAQADGSTTRRYGGTGLGLSIARQLCELMGGSISVESEVGVGSIFRFSVIVGTVADDPAADAPANWPALKDKSVLVLDDNQTNLEIIDSQLTRIGVHVRCVTDPAVALALLREHAESRTAFDFVLIDKNLPSIDGRELARRIRADRVLSGARVIMLSSSDEGADSSSGVDRWLTKPVRKRELYECLSLLASAPEPLPSSPMPAASGSQHSSGVRVLLVEDNEVNLELSRILLQLEGCEVTPATDGRKGVEAFRNGTFNMVFMDCQMPEMDGFEATAAIRAIEAGSSRHTPIIAVTASAIEGDRERCLRAGMDDYLAKPVSRHAIQTMLTRWRSDKIHNSDDPETRTEEYAPEKEAMLSEAVLTGLRDLENEADGGIVQRLMSGFLHSSPELLDDLRRGSAARDAGAIRAAAHTLKSASRVIGALALSARCATLEALAHEGCSDELLALVEEVIAEYESIRPAVEAQLARAAELAADG